ncbi:hypothetical protein BDV98DRAFT_575600 [Pterulicium gracile]|uniref:Uncharacterized protein n=1 Tax=Pterulicium gracile TaxID=1884261 RepID=A0A5C3Q8Q9_9AGAR|nr:hypothetical protein BDV98DRAFT_575600 [Pterula gracilis]
MLRWLVNVAPFARRGKSHNTFLTPPPPSIAPRIHLYFSRTIPLPPRAGNTRRTPGFAQTRFVRWLDPDSCLGSMQLVVPPELPTPARTPHPSSNSPSQLELPIPARTPHPSSNSPSQLEFPSPDSCTSLGVIFFAVVTLFAVVTFFAVASGRKESSLQMGGSMVLCRWRGFSRGWNQCMYYYQRVVVRAALC